jgi:hypothetical protein
MLGAGQTHVLGVRFGAGTAGNEGHDKPMHDKPMHDKPMHDKPMHDKPMHDKPMCSACGLVQARLRTTTLPLLRVHGEGLHRGIQAWGEPEVCELIRFRLGMGGVGVGAWGVWGLGSRERGVAGHVSQLHARACLGRMNAWVGARPPPAGVPGLPPRPPLAPPLAAPLAPPPRPALCPCRVPGAAVSR